MSRESMKAEIDELRRQSNLKRAMEICEDVGFLFNKFEVHDDNRGRILSLYLKNDTKVIDIIVKNTSFIKETIDGIEHVVQDLSKTEIVMRNING